jgi:palmitoyl-protein thioesterase
VPLQVLLQALGPFAIDESAFNFTKYLDDSSTWSGKFQRDFIETAVTDADLHAKSSILNTMRPPLSDAALANWLKIDSFLPKVNNLEACGTSATCRSEQARRKANFVKLQAAHFFASPQDDIQVPWQTSVLGLYSTVPTVDAVETKFKNFTIVDMKQTKEYKNDLYGLKTLDSAKKLFTHAVAGVPHNCWLFDYTSLATDVLCHHDPVYAANIYPLLV